jgi:hypothetical protein
MEHDTFTGQSLSAMTLSQKLLELGEDRLRSLALRATFWQNLRALGLLDAVRYSRAQRALGARGALAEAVASADAQIAADLAAIHADPEAHASGAYRGGGADALAQVLAAFDVPRVDALAHGDLRRYLADHRRRLAKERARLGLPADGPNLRRAAAEHAPALILLGIVALSLLTGWGVDRRLARPRHAFQPLAPLPAAAPSEVRASRLMLDAAIRGRALAARCHDGAAGPTVARDVAALAAVVREARAACDDALEDFRALDGAVTAVVEGASHLARAWSHTERDEEVVEIVHGQERDSDGNYSRTTETQVTCVYTEHTWRYEIARGRAAAAAFTRAKARRAEAARPSVTREEAPRPAPRGWRPWLDAVPVTRRLTLERALEDRHLWPNPSGAIGPWEESELLDPTAFPPKTVDIDRSCGEGRAPAEYTFSAVGLPRRAAALDLARVEFRRALVVGRGGLDDVLMHARALGRGGGSAPCVLLGDAATELHVALRPTSWEMLPRRARRWWALGAGAAVGLLALLLYLPLRWRRDAAYYKRLFELRTDTK